MRGSCLPRGAPLLGLFLLGLCVPPCSLRTGGWGGGGARGGEGGRGGGGGEGGREGEGGEGGEGGGKGGEGGEGGGEGGFQSCFKGGGRGGDSNVLCSARAGVPRLSHETGFNMGLRMYCQKSSWDMT